MATEFLLGDVRYFEHGLSCMMMSGPALVMRGLKTVQGPG